MSAPILAARTAAETALAESFDAALPTLPGGAELRRLREASFGSFYAAGLPHRRVEAWHYTDLRALMRDALPLAAPPDAAARDALRRRLAGSKHAQRLIIVDGAFAPDLSDPMPPGVTVRAMAAALGEGRADLMTLLAAQVCGGADPLVALNAALMQDGVVIEVAPGAQVAHPIRLVHASTAAEPCAIYSRSALIVGAGAKVRLAEESLAATADIPPHRMQTNGCLIVAVGDEAQVALTAALTGMARGSLRIETLIARLGARARLDGFGLIADDGALVRRQIYLRFDGAGAEGWLGGVSLLRGRAHADTTLNVEHIAPGCTGREQFRYVLDDEATGVFQGRINVAKEAQKTDGRMLSKALLLSDAAAMNNKPELEIFADDVACGHGATCGGLSADQLFYMQTRGLPFAEAEALLLEAFAAELIDEIADEGLAASFRADVVGWLAARGSAT